MGITVCSWNVRHNHRQARSCFFKKKILNQSVQLRFDDALLKSSWLVYLFNCIRDGHQSLPFSHWLKQRPNLMTFKHTTVVITGLFVSWQFINYYYYNDIIFIISILYTLPWHVIMLMDFLSAADALCIWYCGLDVGHAYTYSVT